MQSGLIFGILIFALSIGIVKLEAQNPKAYNKHLGQIKFSLTAFISNRLELDNTGAPLLSTSPRFGGEGTVLFSQPLFHGFSLNAGIAWSVFSYNYSYHFIIPPGSIFDLGENQVPFFTTRGFNPHVEKSIHSFPISLQKTFELGRNKTLKPGLEAGIKINTRESFPYSSQTRSFSQTTDQMSAQYFGYDFESAGREVFVSYLIMAGLLKDNLNGNSLSCNVVYHFSPVIIGTGEYQFHNLGFESFGRMEQNVNYIGLEITYGLRLPKKGQALSNY